MKILLTGAFNYSDNQIEEIKNLGHEVLFVQDERCEVPFGVSDIDAVVCNNLFSYNSIENFKNLKYIQLLSAGIDRIPLEYIKQHGIKLYNAKGVYSIPIAEYAVCGILQIYKKSSFFFENQKTHKWEKDRNLHELSGKAALIVGTGSIGTAIAKRLKAFDVKVNGIDINVIDNESFDAIYSVEQIETELKNADILILTLPLTDETEGMFNKSKFDLMKKNSVLVNVARGALINEKDLISALRDRKIYGAVLDVFENEPLNETSPLWDMDNVIISPHNSFIGERNSVRMFNLIMENLER